MKCFLVKRMVNNEASDLNGEGWYLLAVQVVELPQSSSPIVLACEPRAEQIQSHPFWL